MKVEINANGYIENYEVIKGKIKYILTGEITERNNLENRVRVHVCGDIYKVFIVDFGNSNIQINEPLLNTWGIDKATLYKVAKANTEIETPLIKTLESELTELGKLTADEDDNESGMLIVTTQEKMMGAHVILNPCVRRMVEKKLGDFYVLPSSIHETLCIKKKKQTVDELKWVVKDINETQVAPDERLSNNVFEFVDGRLRVVR